MRWALRRGHRGLAWAATIAAICLAAPWAWTLAQVRGWDAGAGRLFFAYTAIFLAPLGLPAALAAALWPATELQRLHRALVAAVVVPIALAVAIETHVTIDEAVFFWQAQGGEYARSRVWPLESSGLMTDGRTVWGHD